MEEKNPLLVTELCKYLDGSITFRLKEKDIWMIKDHELKIFHGSDKEAVKEILAMISKSIKLPRNIT